HEGAGAGLRRLGDRHAHAAVLEGAGGVEAFAFEVEALHAKGRGDVAAGDKRGRAFVQVDLGRGRSDGQVLSVAGDDAHQPELVIRRIARARGSTHTPPTRLWGSSLSARRPYGESK